MISSPKFTYTPPDPILLQIDIGSEYARLGEPKYFVVVKKQQIELEEPYKVSIARSWSSTINKLRLQEGEETVKNNGASSKFSINFYIHFPSFNLEILKNAYTIKNKSYTRVGIEVNKDVIYKISYKFTNMFISKQKRILDLISDIPYYDLWSLYGIKAINNKHYMFLTQNNWSFSNEEPQEDKTILFNVEKGRIKDGLSKANE